MQRSSLIPPIVYRYIAREISAPFLISLFVFTGVLFLARSLKLVDLVVNKNVPAGDILLLFSYIIPRFLEIAVPMSLLLATVLAFGRLSHDSELVVLRATGISLKRLAVPVLAFAFATLCLTLIISFWLRPWANHRLGLGLFEIAKTQASAGLIAGTFNDLGQLTIYAEDIQNHGERLNNVIIGDRRESDSQRTFIAKYGKVISNSKDRTLTLKLYEGMMIQGREDDFTITNFEINSLSLPHSELIGKRPSRGGKRDNEMFITELLHALSPLTDTQTKEKEDEKPRKKQLAEYRVELHKRIVIPFSCLCIALIAMALGIQPSRGGHTWGAAANVGAGIFLILFYYIMFAVASAVGEQGAQPTWLIMWTPNILFAALGFYLFNRMGSEQWMAVSQALGDKITWLSEKCKMGSSLQTKQS